MGSDSTYHADCDDLITALRPLANQCRVEDAYWISTPHGDYVCDSGASDWCFECGRAKMRNLRKNDRKRASDYRLDGGWATEHDTPPMCAHCGVKLRASLLVYGGLYELDHFRDNSPVPGNITHAYEISEMLSALRYTKPEHNKFAAEAIQIARRLIAQLPIAENRVLASDPQSIGVDLAASDV